MRIPFFLVLVSLIITGCQSLPVRKRGTPPATEAERAIEQRYVEHRYEDVISACMKDGISVPYRTSMLIDAYRKVNELDRAIAIAEAKLPAPEKYRTVALLAADRGYLNRAHSNYSIFLSLAKDRRDTRIIPFGAGNYEIPENWIMDDDGISTKRTKMSDREFIVTTASFTSVYGITIRMSETQISGKSEPGFLSEWIRESFKDVSDAFHRDDLCWINPGHVSGNRVFAALISPKDTKAAYVPRSDTFGAWYALRSRSEKETRIVLIFTPDEAPEKAKNTIVSLVGIVDDPYLPVLTEELSLLLGRAPSTR